MTQLPQKPDAPSSGIEQRNDGSMSGGMQAAQAGGDIVQVQCIFNLNPFTLSNSTQSRSEQLEIQNRNKQTIELHYQVPKSDDSFIGCEQLIQEMLVASDQVHMISILGISGIGKTALMTKVASCFEPETVFWYECKAGLTSFNSIVNSLAAFLDSKLESEEKLEVLFYSNFYGDDAKVEVLTERLNRKKFHLFFDSVHSLDEDEKINSFFSILKQKLRKGSVFVSSRFQPSFYKAIDETRKTIKVFTLAGLEEADVEKIFNI